jgi:HD-like signal output (HDOD) protein
MSDTLSKWIKSFNNCEIPVLLESKRKIHYLQKNDEDITVTVLAEIARQDPGFSMSLLRHACRSKNREITTLPHAISLIGIPIVIKMLNNLPVLEKVLDKNILPRMLNEYSRQYLTAYMAREWSIMRKESENQEIYTAALNRGFVRFILYLIDPDKAIKLEQIYLTPDDKHKDKENELLGNNVDEIAQAVANHWKLPELIRENYSGKHHNPKITGIRLVAELLRQIYSHSSIQYPEEIINRIAEYIRVPVNQAPGKINWIIVNSIRNSEKHIPCHSLLQMIMSYPASIKKETKKIEAKEENTVFSDCIKLLRSKDPNKSARELIEITIKALKEGIGFSRVTFMSFDKNENCLETKFQSIDKGLPNIKPLRISMELNKLFNQLLKKEQTLCITNKNQHKFSDILPNALRPMKPLATIIINSFYVNNKVTGCFFVDHGKTNKQLTTNELQSFKLVCTELKTAIESSILKKNPVKKVA